MKILAKILGAVIFSLGLVLGVATVASASPADTLQPISTL